MFHNKIPVLFPLTRMDLDSNPPRFSSSSVKNMTMKIKKGSKPFRKVLEKTYDFLTGDRLDRWRQASKNNNISEENLRKAFKMISCKHFNAKQKDKILKFLCRKTIYNNQVEHVYQPSILHTLQNKDCPLFCLVYHMNIMHAWAIMLNSSPTGKKYI